MRTSVCHFKCRLRSQAYAIAVIVGLDARDDLIKNIPTPPPTYQLFLSFLRGHVDDTSLQQPTHFDHHNGQRYRPVVALCLEFGELLRARETTSRDEDHCQCLWSMAQIDMALLYQVVESWTIDEADESVWSEIWTDLRVYSVSLANVRDDFRTYAQKNFQNPKLRKQINDTKEALRRLQTHIEIQDSYLQDKIQTLVSLRSLEASRQSIEESKSVKLGETSSMADNS